jgi:hypothetical protein
MRQRTISASTIGAMDAGLPATPTFAVERAIAHQHSEGRLDNRRVAFPMPHVPSPMGVTRHDSAGSRHTSYSIEPSLSSTPEIPSPSPDNINPPRRQPSMATTSSIHPSIASHIRRRSSALSPSWASQSQPPANWVERKLQIHQSHSDDYYEDEDGSVRRRSEVYEDEEYEDDRVWDDEEEEVEEVNEIRFFQPAFLSEAALQLRDRVERRRQTKAGIAWVGSFTGRDIVVSRVYLTLLIIDNDTRVSS